MTCDVGDSGDRRARRALPLPTIFSPFIANKALPSIDAWASLGWRLGDPCVALAWPKGGPIPNPISRGSQNCAKYQIPFTNYRFCQRPSFPPPWEQALPAVCALYRYLFAFVKRTVSLADIYGKKEEENEVYLLSDSQYYELAKRSFNAYVLQQRQVTVNDVNVVLPNDAGTYYLIFNNKFSVLESRGGTPRSYILPAKRLNSAPSNLIADPSQCLDRHQVSLCTQLYQGLAPQSCQRAL